MFKVATIANIKTNKQHLIHKNNYTYYQSADLFFRAWYSEGSRLNLALNARAK